MVIAQAITDYGGIASLIAAAVSAFDYAADSLSRLDASTWIVVFSGVFLVWLIVGRAR